MSPIGCIFLYPNFYLIENAQFPGFKTRPDYREQRTNTVGETKLNNCLRTSNYKDLYNAIYLPREMKKSGLGFVNDSTDAFVFWHNVKNTTVEVAHFDLVDEDGTKQFFYTLIEHSQKPNNTERKLMPNALKQYHSQLEQQAQESNQEIIILDTELEHLID